MKKFLLTFLKGKMTYLSAGLMILWGLFGLWKGLGDPTGYWNAIFTGLAVFGIRRAM